MVDGTWIGASRLTQRSSPGRPPPPSSVSGTRMPRSTRVSSSSWMKNALPPQRAAIWSISSSTSGPGTSRSATISRRAASVSSSSSTISVPSSLASRWIRGSGRLVITPRIGRGVSDLEQRGEQLLALLIGPVDVLAEHHQRLVALEPLLDPDQQLDQGLAPGVGVDLGVAGGLAVRMAPTAAARTPSSMPTVASAVRASGEASSPGIDQRQRAQQPALDLVGLGVLGEAEHVAREIGEHAVRRHRRADPRRGPDHHGLAGRQAGEEAADQRALADPGVADR